MAYKALIFDFFDVIHSDFFQGWLRKHGMPREGAVHQASVEIDHGRIDVAEFLNRLSQITGQPAADIKAQFDELSKVDHDLTNLIRGLQDKYQIALLSNASSVVVRHIMSQHDLESLFHEIVISSDVDMIKPDPKIFEHTLAKLGVKPSEAIFIDDNIKNVEGAQAVGITGIQFTDTPSLRADLKKLGIELPH